MPIMIKSSEVQQNFGRVIDQTLIENEVIVERYGKPRVAILSYQRYQQLLQTEAARQHLVPPDSNPEAIAQGKKLAAQVRQELADSLDGSLEETMGTLRGRSWSS
ncbi:MAG: type II toxin-antitoxin system Phd/YefM family antitoxin [Chloroflexi bacterium]|nr:type II toxin-antitoxin system Phd/YefM family antitoxin [Chloroflexota bacterium]